ncbi:hypothetical protein FO519_007425 [Halicephalobus sp. NKZ332]|nr:hypothetical protein FO519_007425 [Halicephalobus sp. NKZ332]
MSALSSSQSQDNTANDQHNLEKWKKGAKDLQERFYILNAGRMYEIAEDYDQIELKILISSFGNLSDCRQCTGLGLNCYYSQTQRKLAIKMRNKIQEHSKSEEVFMNVVYIMSYLKEGQETIVPVFYFKADKKIKYIDLQARVYDDWQDFLNKNLIHPSLCCYPVNGHYGQKQNSDELIFNEGIKPELKFSQLPLCNKTSKVLENCKGYIDNADTVVTYSCEFLNKACSGNSPVAEVCQVCIKYFPVATVLTKMLCEKQCMSSDYLELSNVIFTCFGVVVSPLIASRIFEEVQRQMRRELIRVNGQNAAGSNTINTENNIMTNEECCGKYILSLINPKNEKVIDREIVRKIEVIKDIEQVFCNIARKETVLDVEDKFFLANGQLHIDGISFAKITHDGNNTTKVGEQLLNELGVENQKEKQDSDGAEDVKKEGRYRFMIENDIQEFEQTMYFIGIDLKNITVGKSAIFKDMSINDYYKFIQQVNKVSDEECKANYIKSTMILADRLGLNSIEEICACHQILLNEVTEHIKKLKGIGLLHESRIKTNELLNNFIDDESILKKVKDYLEDAEKE